MLDIGDRLSSYEPLWENWYKDDYLGGGSFGKVYRLKQNFFGETRYSAVKVIPIILDQELTTVHDDKRAFVEQKKASVVQEIMSRRFIPQKVILNLRIEIKKSRADKHGSSVHHISETTTPDCTLLQCVI